MTITIFEFSTWDAATSQLHTSKRLGTLDAIIRANGTPDMSSSREVDDRALDGAGFLREGLLAYPARQAVRTSIPALSRSRAFSSAGPTNSE